MGERESGCIAPAVGVRPDRRSRTADRLEIRQRITALCPLTWATRSTRYTLRIAFSPLVHPTTPVLGLICEHLKSQPASKKQKSRCIVASLPCHYLSVSHAHSFSFLDSSLSRCFPIWHQDPPQKKTTNAEQRGDSRCCNWLRWSAKPSTSHTMYTDFFRLHRPHYIQRLAHSPPETRTP